MSFKVLESVLRPLSYWYNQDNIEEVAINRSGQIWLRLRGKRAFPWVMYKDEKLKKFFSEEERKIIKEAIEDHRASSDHEPRSIYGKIVSSADRNNTVEQCLERSYYYGKKLDPNASETDLYKRAFFHLNEKFGENGYAKFFLKDSEYEQFLLDIRKILKDEKEFCEIQANYIKKLEKREN